MSYSLYWYMPLIHLHRGRIEACVQITFVQIYGPVVTCCTQQENLDPAVGFYTAMTILLLGIICVHTCAWQKKFILDQHVISCWSVLRSEVEWPSEHVQRDLNWGGELCQGEWAVNTNSKRGGVQPHQTEQARIWYHLQPCTLPPLNCVWFPRCIIATLSAPPSTSCFSSPYTHTHTCLPSFWVGGGRH